MSTLHDTLPTVATAPVAVSALADALAARGLLAGPLSGPSDAMVSDVTLDSRRAGDGVLFAAVAPDTLSGRDGHDFVDDALARGATAALVSDEWLGQRTSTPVPLGKGERLPGPSASVGGLAEAAGVSVDSPRWGR